MAIKNIDITNEESSDFPYKSLVVYLIAIKFIFKNYLNLRQYKRLSSNKPIPKELAELNIKQENYIKTKVYSKDKMKFHVFHELFEIL